MSDKWKNFDHADCFKKYSFVVGTNWDDQPPHTQYRVTPPFAMYTGGR
jgi:hypothetical protein